MTLEKLNRNVWIRVDHDYDDQQTCTGKPGRSRGPICGARFNRCRSVMRIFAPWSGLKHTIFRIVAVQRIFLRFLRPVVNVIASVRNAGDRFRLTVPNLAVRGLFCARDWVIVMASRRPRIGFICFTIESAACWGVCCLDKTFCSSVMMISWMSFHAPTVGSAWSSAPKL